MNEDRSGQPESVTQQCEARWRQNAIEESGLGTPINSQAVDRRDAGQETCDTKIYYFVQRQTLLAPKALYVCFDCGNNFANSAALAAHKESYLSCHDCRILFKGCLSLVQHRRTHSEETPHKCLECGKCFGDNRLLLDHLRTHVAPEFCICTDCGKSFTDMATLITHQEIHAKYTCDKCGSVFTFRCSLTMHQKEHDAEKPVEDLKIAS